MTVSVEPEDRFLTRREAQLLMDGDRHTDEAHALAHSGEHEYESTALGKAYVSHEEKHRIENDAVKTAYSSASNALKAALDDHHREHVVHENAHAREHSFTEQALYKAEQANDKRFSSVNAFREQLSHQAASFVTRESFESLSKEMDRRIVELSKLAQERYETNRASIINIEKGDVKQEGRGIGQGTVIAAIVTMVSVVGGLLGITIVIANLATSS